MLDQGLYSECAAAIATQIDDQRSGLFDRNTFISHLDLLDCVCAHHRAYFQYCDVIPELEGRSLETDAITIKVLE